MQGPSIDAKERPVPEVHSLIGFMYDLELVTSASSNYHVLSLFHCSFHVRAHAVLMFEPLSRNCYRLDPGATALLKPGVGEEGGRHRPLRPPHLSSNAFMSSGMSLGMACVASIPHIAHSCSSSGPPPSSS